VPELVFVVFAAVDARIDWERLSGEAAGHFGKGSRTLFGQ